MQYIIRNAEIYDLPRIEDVYAGARRFMAEHGNPTQWGTTNPPVERLIQDIEERLLFVITVENNIHGVFYLFIGDDPTYETIHDGMWHSDRIYGTIHRIAGDGSGGILKAAVEFALKKIDYLRIDTHHDNIIMQKAVQKIGFQPCGIIYVSDGTPRIAYDLLKQS